MASMGCAPLLQLRANRRGSERSSARILRETADSAMQSRHSSRQSRENKGCFDFNPAGIRLGSAALFATGNKPTCLALPPSPRISISFPNSRPNSPPNIPAQNSAPTASRFRKTSLIEFVKGHDTALIGLDRFTDRVCAALPELKTLCLCSAGVDHLDPVVLNKYGIKMYWAAGINKVSVSELAVAFMVFTRAQGALLLADPAARRMERPDWIRARTCADRPSAFTAAAISARKSSSCCSPTA